MYACIFSVGNKWRYPGLKVRNDKDALMLLALEVYFQASGCRYNLIKVSKGVDQHDFVYAKSCPYRGKQYNLKSSRMMTSCYEIA